MSAGWFTNCREHVPVTVVFCAFPGLFNAKFTEPLKSLVDFPTVAHDPVGVPHGTVAVTEIVKVEKSERFRFFTVTLVAVWLIVPLDVVALTFWNPGGIV
ncbi:MAG: hypothetical protein WBM72_11455, partial [Actinomycetota bacterium]